MTLDEAFKNFKDTDLLRRKDNYFSGFNGYPIGWLKDLHELVNNFNEREGFSLPPKFIEYVNADDWEFYNEV